VEEEAKKAGIEMQCPLPLKARLLRKSPKKLLPLRAHDNRKTA